MRLLADEVAAIRIQLEAVEIKDVVSEARPINVRLTLLERIRRGREIADEPYPVAVDKSNPWTWAMVRLLSQHVSFDAAERFLTTTGATGLKALEDRLDFLENLVDEV